MHLKATSGAREHHRLLFDLLRTFRSVHPDSQLPVPILLSASVGDLAIRRLDVTSGDRGGGARRGTDGAIRVPKISVSNAGGVLLPFSTVNLELLLCILFYQKPVAATKSTQKRRGVQKQINSPMLPMSPMSNLGVLSSGEGAYSPLNLWT